jgi:hypothetical protein
MPKARPYETALGVYMRETGTRSVWLAEQVGVTDSKVCRWLTGATGMSEADKRKVLVVLRERAAVSLDGLLDDQAELGPQGPRPRPRRHVGRSPYERLLAERDGARS